MESGPVLVVMAVSRSGIVSCCGAVATTGERLAMRRMRP